MEGEHRRCHLAKVGCSWMPAMLDIRTDRARRSCSAVAPRVRSWLCTIHRPDSSLSRMMLASPARTPSEAKYDRFNPFGRDSRITSGKRATVMIARVPFDRRKARLATCLAVHVALQQRLRAL